MLTETTPDALMVPDSAKRGGTMYERLRSVLLPAEARLGVDRSRGERARLRKQPGGWSFVTKDVEDTILFPSTSPLRGQPRYTWIPQPDGSQFGYLVDAARAETRETRNP